jgi:soluble lytic murein transglycosylase-like protein
MHRWAIASMLVVAGCGFFRDAPVVDTVSVSDDVGIPPTVLERPETRAWMRRLCVRTSGAPAVGLGMARAQRDLPRLRAILVEHGLPGDLVAVPAVESRFQPGVRGRHGERGIWQLRPGTARRFGLQVDAAVDERLRADRATQGAARYLGFLYARYRDWPLALAAYNAGEGRVDRALARRPGATFWELAQKGALPRGSRDYVPKVMAVMRLTAPDGRC